MSLGTLYVDLQANTGGFVSALSKAAAEAQKSTKEMSRSFGELREIASQTFGAFGNFNPIVSKLSLGLEAAGRAASSTMKSLSGVGGAIGPLAALGAGAAVGFTALASAAAGVAIETAKSVDEMGHLAESSGVSVEILSKLSFVAKQYDIDQESLAKGLQMMQVQMLKAATAGPNVVTAFDRLHLSVRNTTGGLKDADTMFTEIIAKLNAMKDRAAAVGFAREIFGRQTGAAVLRIDPSGLEDWSKVAKETGIVINDQMFAAAHQFETSLNVIGAAAHGLALRVETEMLPALQAIVDALVKVSKDGSSTFSDLLAGLSPMIKGILAVGQTLYAFLDDAGSTIGTDLGYWEEAFVGFAAVAKKALKFDFSGASAVWHEEVERLTAIDKEGAAHRARIWADNDKFIKGIFGTTAITPREKPKPDAVDADINIKKPGILGIPPVDQIADFVSKLGQ